MATEENRQHRGKSFWGEGPKKPKKGSKKEEKREKKEEPGNEWKGAYV